MEQMPAKRACFQQLRQRQPKLDKYDGDAKRQGSGIHGTSMVEGIRQINK